MDGSLKSIGETVGLPKLHLTEEEYTTIDQLNPAKLEIYGMRDVYISQALVNTMGREMLDNLTISGAVKKDFSSYLAGPNYKSHRKDIYSKKYEFVHETRAREARENSIHQQSYFGGDNETINPCILDEG